jgi:hypothetical protein
VAVSLAALALAGVGAAGCSLGGGDEKGDKKPKRVTGTPNEAVSVVGQFQRATARADYRAICDGLFTASARRRAGGRRCVALLRSRAGDVRRPRIDLLGIELRGDRARVRIRSRASGQPPATDVLDLVRQGGRYRIDALGD